MALEKLTVILHGVDELSDVASGAMDSLGKLGALAAGAVTTGVLGLGAAALGAGMTMDEALDNIVVKTGATGEELEGLQDSFRNVFKRVPADAQTVADAIAVVGQRTDLTGVGVEKLATYLVDLSRLTNTDVTQSANQLLDVLGSWNVEFDQGATVLDTFFAASQASGAGVNELMGQVQSGGAVLREMGFSLEESIGLMANLSRTGLDSTQVLLGMRAASAEFAKENIPVRAGLEETFRAIKNATDRTEALRIATETFGTRAGPLMANAIREGTLSLDDLTAILHETGGGIIETAEATDDFGQTWQVIMNRITLALEPAGAAIMDLVSNLLDALMPALETIIPPIADFLSKLGEVIGALFESGAGSEEFAAALTNMFGPEVAGAIQTVIDLIVQIKDAIVAFIQEQIIPFVQEHAEAFKAALIAIGAVIAAAAIASAITGIAGAIAALANPITAIIAVVGLLAAAWSEDWLGIRTTVEGVVNAIRPAIENAFNAIRSAIEGVINFIRPVIEGWINAVRAWFETNWPAIRQAAETAWNAIRTVIETVVNAVRQIIEAVVGGIVAWLQEHWDAIRAAVETVWNAIRTVIETVINVIEDIVGGFIALLRGDWEGFTQGIQQAWDDLWGGVRQTAEGLWDAIRTPIENVVNGIRNFFNQDWGAIGRGVLEGIGSGITNAVQNVVNTVSNAVNNIISGIKGWLGIASPAKRMAIEVGGPMGEGLVEGMRRALAGATAADLGLETVVGAGRTFAAGAGEVAPMGGVPGKAGTTVVFQYAPFVSTASQEEAAFAIRPMIEQILRDNGVIA